MKKIFFLGLIIISIFLSSFSFADVEEGWNGYGLYLLNSDQLSIIEEDIFIKFDNGKLEFQGEFIIKNDSKERIKAVIGTPDNSITGIKLIDKGISLRWRKRTLGGITNEFKLEGKIPSEAKWYTYNINFDAGETKIINLSYSTKATEYEESRYVISYYNDRNKGYNNKSLNSNIEFKLEDYVPYNVLSLEGLNISNIDENGNIKLLEEENIVPINIQYQLLDRAIVDYAKSSLYKKPKQIAYSYGIKDYEEAIELCDEYIDNPLDENLQIEQIKFIKAECFRNLLQFDNFINEMSQVDLNKLQPSGAIYKVLYDKLLVYTKLGNEENQKAIIKQFHEASSENNPIMKMWLDWKGYKLPQVPVEPVKEEIVQPEPADVKDNNFFYKTINMVNNYKYNWIIALAIGLLIGFIIGRISKKNRRRGSSLYFYKR